MTDELRTTPTHEMITIAFKDNDLARWARESEACRDCASETHPALKRQYLTVLGVYESHYVTSEITISDKQWKRSR
jgi:hypothetical protein